eukprot:COSAG05_NODE_9240_length_637_cov_1.122677_2_plen_105_part_00
MWRPGKVGAPCLGRWPALRCAAAVSANWEPCTRREFSFFQGVMDQVKGIVGSDDSANNREYAMGLIVGLKSGEPRAMVSAAAWAVSCPALMCSVTLTLHVPAQT